MNKYQYICKTCGTIMDNSLGHKVSGYSILPDIIIDSTPPNPFERGVDVLHCPGCNQRSSDFSIIEFAGMQ